MQETRQKEAIQVNSNLSTISCVVFINIMIFIIHSGFILDNVVVNKLLEAFFVCSCIGVCCGVDPMF